ncbi:DUF748 domain-containing protein [Oxalobacter sp. OttesenSCG-928-P03]|nr:DUF748 domain-containing protein [Oxalobacter sp. OttesenSCG-928-P03]
MKKPDITKLKTFALSFFSRYRRKIIIGASAFFCILFISGLCGWLFLPGYIKDKAEQAVAESLHRKLTITEVSFNPFSLSVTLKGVTLSEKESEETFVSFDRLYVNLSTLSAITMSPVIKAVELENPYIHFSRLNKNEYNISDFIEMAMKPDEPDKKPFSYSVNNIQVDGGRIIFDDHPMKAQHRIEEISIRIPYISSRLSRVETFIEPHLSALVNGTKMELSGKTRPFAEDKETIFSLDLKNVELPRYMEYLPYKPDFHLAKGSLNVDLNLHFTQYQTKPSELDISGTAELHSLLVTDLAKKPMLGLGRLAVKMEKNAIFASDYNIAKIELSQPEVYVVNSADGYLNLMNLAPKAEKGAAAKADQDSKEEKSLPLKLALKQFVLTDGKLSYTDYGTGMPYSVTAGKFNLTVDDVAVDTGARSARIGKIASDSAAIEMALEKKQGGHASSRAKPDSGSSAFGVDIGSIDISGWSAHMQNKNLKKPLGAQITGLAVNAQDISTAPGKTSALKVSAGVDKKGHILVEGKLGVSPLSADLAVDLKNVSIVALQQYIDEHVNLTLRQADVTTKGRLTLATGRSGALSGEYSGDVSLGNLLTTDQIKGDQFVRWKDLSLKQMQVKLSPFSLTAKRADLNSFYARLILNADGRLNLQNILRSEAGGKKSLTETEEHFDFTAAIEQPDKAAGKQEQATTPPQTAVAAQPEAGVAQAESGKQAEAVAAEAQPEAPVQAAGETVDMETNEPVAAPPVAKAPVDLPPIRIDRFQLTNGRVRFTDNFIKPHYTADMNKVHGVITRIASTGNAIAVVDIKGQVNRAPLTVTGSLNPFNPALSLELEGHVKGMELAQFSSYSTKYVGYGIEKGKLSFDVQYKVEEGELHAENRLVLDQLTFGEKSESKPVISLPVQLAVNLLKDGDGVIDINLPVSGSLNDPEFSVGGIVFRVIVNLVKKVITSPFSLLSAAFGGGEELSWLEFAPGSTDISDAGVEKLTTLVKALKGRPGLKLDVTGCYAPDADKEGLARKAINRRVRELKRKEMGAEGESLRLSEIKVSDKEYAKLLKEVYSDADFKKPRNFIGFQKSLPVAEMEKLMIENYAVSEEEFMGLADKRAANVKAWLMEKGEIPEERVFIQASKSKSGDNATRVDFSLH